MGWQSAFQVVGTGEVLRTEGVWCIHARVFRFYSRLSFSARAVGRDQGGSVPGRPGRRCATVGVGRDRVLMGLANRFP